MQAVGPQSGLVLHVTAQIWPEQKKEAQKDTFLVKLMNQDIITLFQPTAIRLNRKLEWFQMTEVNLDILLAFWFLLSLFNTVQSI